MEERLSPFLAALAEHAEFSAGVIFLDADERYLLVSRRIAEFDGITSSEHVGRHPREVVPDLWERCQPYVDRALAGEAVTFEVTREGPVHEGRRVIRAHAFPVRAPDGPALGVGITVDDVTALRDGQSELMTARRRATVAKLAEQALAGTATIDQLCEAAATEVATTLQVPISRVVAALPGSTHLEMRGGVGVAWNSEIAGARPGSYVEYVMRAGEPVVIDDLAAEKRFRPPEPLLRAGVRSSIAMAVRSSHGPWGILSAHAREHRGFAEGDVAFLRDIADVLSLAVQAQETMAFQRELISIASHEMRTPLTTIVGMGQRLQRELKRRLAEDELADLARTVVEEGMRLNGMIERWLGLTEIEAGLGPPRLERLEMGEHIARQVANARKRHPDLEITAHHPLEPVEVETDGERVAEILDNLIENAVRHAGPSAQVEVWVERCGERTIAIHVADDGPGVPPEIQRRIFERFYRGPDRHSRGMGMGLYVSRALAEGLGGTLEVASDAGRGATFTLTLPG